MYQGIETPDEVRLSEDESSIVAIKWPWGWHADTCPCVDCANVKEAMGMA